MDGSETLEAKMLSGGSGYDLIFPGDTVAERLMRAGSLMPLDQAKLSELADIEPGLQKLRGHYEHSSKATVPYTWGTIGLTYNEEQIKNAWPTRRSTASTCCSNRSWRQSLPIAGFR